MKNTAVFLALMCMAIITNASLPKSDNDASASKAKHQTYKVLKKIKIGGEGGWDYTALDTVNRRLYISHGTKVDILDVDKEQVVGEIPNTNGVHGICFAYSLNKGFTSNGRDSSVTMFDLTTLKIIKKIKINGANPDCIIYDPYTNRVFTFNGRSHNASAINAETGMQEGTVNLDGKPEFSASDNQGKVFVNIEDKNEVQVIDPKMLTVTSTWKLESGDEPSGLAYNATHKRLFVACGNKTMIVLNAENGTQVKKIAIGDGVDAAGYNSHTGYVFTSNGEGNLTVVHETSADDFSDPMTVITIKGARTLAVDEKKDLVYLPCAEYGAPTSTEPGKKPRPSVIPGSFSIMVVGH